MLQVLFNEVYCIKDDQKSSLSFSNSLLPPTLPQSPWESKKAWAGIFKEYMGARHWVWIGLSYRPARLHGWRNSFLGIYSWAQQTFKNTGSGWETAMNRNLAHLSLILVLTGRHLRIADNLTHKHTHGAIELQSFWNSNKNRPGLRNIL